MPGFFPHLGGGFAGFTSQPETTFANILNDIVTDVGAGINGWTLYDDQRTSGTTNFQVALANCGGRFGPNSSASITFTSASSQITSLVANGARFFRNWAGSTGSGVTASISTDQVNWYTVSSCSYGVAATCTGTLSAPFAQTTVSTAVVYEKFTSYIVLACSSSIKPFYVLLMRTNGLADALRVQVYETWNSATHSGTNPGPQEVLRAYDTINTANVMPSHYTTLSFALRYALWLMPHAFGLYVGGGSSLYPYVMQQDFFYAGNLITSGVRPNDNDALIQMCSNQDASGICVANLTNISTSPPGAATVMRNLQGSLWGNPIGPGQPSSLLSNTMQVWPRGMDYIYNINRTALDQSGRLQMCELDAYSAPASATLFTNSEGKRGEVRYLKSPVMNPSGMSFATFSGTDGNTYVMVQASYPAQLGGIWSTAITDTQTTAGTVAASGFASCVTVGSAGELTLGASAQYYLNRRWFLVPINI